MVAIRCLAAGEYDDALDGLAAVLADCVANGASVSFMAPFTQADARAFFAGLSPAVKAGKLMVLAAYDGDALAGTVQVDLATPPNQPHRCEIRKLLVKADARRRGIAWALMLAAEEEARKAGRWLMTLDTVTESPAEKLYRDFGFRRAGVIPDYALMPGGGAPVPTTILYKSLK